MSYTFEELQLIAEALTFLADDALFDAVRHKRIEALADKVVDDQASKGEA